MASITTGQTLVGENLIRTRENIPRNILLYEVSGPFFFGAAERATSALRGTATQIRAIIFLMENVPAMDMTGLVAFESAVKELSARGAQVHVVGLREQPAELLKKSEVLKKFQIGTHTSLDEAIRIAKANHS